MLTIDRSGTYAPFTACLKSASFVKKVAELNAVSGTISKNLWHAVIPKLNTHVMIIIFAFIFYIVKKLENHLVDFSLKN
ncbi:MAG: hypothetical protein NVS3B15_04000 [Sediminibacterium sp.]